MKAPRVNVLPVSSTLDYLELMPGLYKAVALGGATTAPKGYYTVVEMSEQLGIVPTIGQVVRLEQAMDVLHQTLMQVKSAERQTLLGEVSYTQTEYPGFMFPFFSIVLDYLGITYS
jgi:hypothetical protein